MKPFLLISLLCLSFSAHSQDYLDEIAKKSCDCVSTIPDDIEGEALYFQFGVCLLKSSENYEKQLKKDHNIDLLDPEESGEKLGQLIGAKMIYKCPELFESLMAVDDENSEYVDEFSGTGRVEKISDSDFVQFMIKDEEGKSSKYYWLYFIPSNIDLQTEYKSLTGKQVEFYFIEQDFFDPKLKEYRKVKILNEINVAE